MSLASVLKAVGKDLGHVGQWIEVGLKIAEPIVGIVDPPIGTIIMAVEAALAKGTGHVMASDLEKLVTSIATATASKPATSTSATQVSSVDLSAFFKEGSVCVLIANAQSANAGK